ncbi:MAG: carbohydrate ABC transporter permease [Eubacteriales bacterium]|nr:carbohydrate ABC transporter permease [Eubacteriales bacterium]
MKRKANTKVKSSYGEKIFMAIAYTIVALFSICALYPFINVLSTSFSSSRAVGAGEVILFPIEPNLQAYRQLLFDGQILASMKNTVLLTVAGTTFNLVATTLVAYALSKPRLKGRKFFVGMIVFTMLFSGGMIPNFVLIKSLHLMNTFSGLWLMGLISTYNMIVMKTFFEGIPDGLCEAAAIDGANEPTILCRIVLPVSKPVMATMVLFYAVGWWNNYFNPMLYLSSTSKFPMMVKLKQMLDTAKMIEVSAAEGLTQTYIAAETFKAASIIVATLPIICVYPFLQKYFVKGVMIGSIKG